MIKGPKCSYNSSCYFKLSQDSKLKLRSSSLKPLNLPQSPGPSDRLRDQHIRIVCQEAAGDR